MFSRYRRKVNAIFGLVDSILIALAFVAAYFTRFRLNFEKPFYWVFFIDLRVAALLFAVSVVCWLAVGYWLHIYDKLNAVQTHVVFRDTLRQCFLGASCLVLTEYSLRLDLSRFFVIAFATYSWLLLCLFRVNAPRVVGAVRRKFGSLHFVMVAGSGERARQVGRILEQSRAYGVRLTGFLSDEAGHVQLSNRYEQFPLKRLPDLLDSQVIDEIIFAVESERLRDMESVFLLCDEEGVRTRIAVDFFPHVNSTIYLDALGPIPLLTFSAAPDDEIRLLLKRVIDTILAAAALVLLLPLMLAVAILIRLSSAGPVIFRQERCGLNGRHFTFYKFRSMLDNAEEMKAALMHLSHKTTAFKIPNDPRVTCLGRFLRKFSIDELPQLWNVLKGDMSLVGPRPAVPSEVELYERWQRRRLRMRPGLTCLWALEGRDAIDFETWMKMDLQYIDNWSLALDWKVMLRTIPRVLVGKGAN